MKLGDFSVGGFFTSMGGSGGSAFIVLCFVERKDNVH